MRYLKTFEAKDGGLFWEITQNEWGNLINESINFMPSDIEKINLLFTNPLKVNIGCGHNNNTYEFLRNSGYTIVINCLLDEWYVVVDAQSKTGRIIYYKCDQFDGLLDCLKNIL